MYLTTLCMQVWSADAGVAHSPPSDLLWKSQASWGTGDDIMTSLTNTDGEVKWSVHDIHVSLIWFTDHLAILIMIVIVFFMFIYVYFCVYMFVYSDFKCIY